MWLRRARVLPRVQSLSQRRTSLTFRSLATATNTSPYHTLTEEDVSHFQSILSSGNSILSTINATSTEDDLVPFNHDWMGKYQGKSRCVLKPKSVEEVSAILKYCHEKRIAVVPQGGNTGLVGGSVPIHDEVVVSLANMSTIRSFDPVSGVLVCDAGCILDNLSTHIAPHKYIMPLDLGAKGSCHIGGNVATNAGGLRLLRYGSLHGTVLGLEVALADGSIMSELKTVRKDNTGYDLKQLFIGSEGTLGIITGVSILTPPMPTASSTLLVALPSFESLPSLFRLTKSHLSEILSAFEYFDRKCYELVCRHTGKTALDADEVGDSQAFALIETSGGSKEHDEAKLEALLEAMYAEDSLITSGTLSQSQDQFEKLWSFRELIPEAAGKEGKVYKYDVSVPVKKFREVADVLKERLVSKGLVREKGTNESEGGKKIKEVYSYGHFGDGNLHINVTAEAYTPELEAAIEPFIYEVVASHSGSISAEHGIGRMKTHALHYSKGDVSREYMRRIKSVFDERGILNPGKVLE